MANRGRPKKHFEKRQNCAVRLSPQQRDRVIVSAKEHRRSISEEIAWRLERSFLQDDLVAAVREEIGKIKFALEPTVNGAGLSKDEIFSAVQRTNREFARNIGHIFD